MFFGFFEFFFPPDFLKLIGFFFGFFYVFFGFFLKLLWLLLQVTKVTTGHQKSLKLGQNSIISFFIARRAKKASAEG